MPSFTVDFEVECSACGATMSAVGRNGRRNEPIVEVDPCDKCMSNEYERGRDEVE